jgi:1-deoxy-D-xylulose-5-phosphate synthase
MKQHPQALEIGKAEVIQEGDDFAILGLGALLPMAKDLARALGQQGYSAAVINPRFIKPLDRELIARYAKGATALVTFEDHVLMGGFGSVVLETLSEMGIETPVIRIGWPDRFIEHGKVEQLRARHGVSVDAALEKLAPYLKRGAARLVAQSI